MTATTTNCGRYAFPVRPSDKKIIPKIQSCPLSPADYDIQITAFVMAENAGFLTIQQIRVRGYSAAIEYMPLVSNCREKIAYFLAEIFAFPAEVIRLADPIAKHVGNVGNTA